MKRIILTILITAAVTGGGVWWVLHPASPTAPAAEKAAAPDEDAGASGISHDEQGNTVVKMDDDTQGDAGIVVANPPTGEWKPEVKGYGRVLDAGPLVALVNDLAAARVAAAASAQELERQKTLSAQSNTSMRALQTAQAAVDHDQLAVQAAKDGLALGWGTALAGREDLQALVESFAAQTAAMVRVDLPLGESLSAPPQQARVVNLAGQSAEATFLSMAAAVDPQMQGQGFIFFVRANVLGLTPGQAVVGYLQRPGDPIPGVVIPRDAVVRAEGAGWVYTIDKGGESFTRRKIPLDRPMGNGWFVAGEFKTEDFLVVTGAQTLRSEELKAALSSD